MSRELKVLEYANDLKSYYEFGYGSAMNREIQCASGNEVVDLLGNAYCLEIVTDCSLVLHFG